MRFIASAVAVLLLASGCASKSDLPVPKERQQVETLRALPFGTAPVDTVVEVLTQSGVARNPHPAEVTR